VSTQPKTFLTPEQYLEIERQAERKSEYYNGEMFALVVEVLSPSTEAYDRGRKFEQYKAIESLREYLLVASDRIHADLYTRQTDGRWLLTSADTPAGLSGA
jgi:Uma2 family endonuclease